MKRYVCALTAAAMVVTAAPSVQADTRTANLSVTASVVASCTVGTSTLAFGTYDPTASVNVDQTASLSVTCSKGTSATVGLDTGSNASGGVRRMSNGSDYLTYELYKEAARSNVWGNAGAGLMSLVAATSNSPQALSVHGRIPGSQDVGSGSYIDTVLITVTF